MAPDRATRWLLATIFAAAMPGYSLGLAVSTVLPTRGAVHSRILRAGPSDVQMLEAFDLIPVMDCLKLDGMDAVEQCMDKLEPWLAINEGGDVEFSLNAVNGFIGGSVGVIGTVISTMIKKEEVKDRLKCGYCAGSGQILCGHCLSSGTVNYQKEDGTFGTMACPNCEQTGSVVCINCQGSGISVPEEFFTALGDEEVGFTEEDFIGLFDEKPLPSRSDAPETDAPTRDPVGVGSGSGETTKGAAAVNEAPLGVKPSDYIDGTS